MEIRYNVTGERRKEMVAIIGQTLGEKPVYMKVPTYAYKIGEAEVTKEGTKAHFFAETFLRSP